MEHTFTSTETQARAKVNLTLEILGKRADGYHELRSVFREVRLHDVVTVGPAAEIEVRCSRSELEGPANLAYAAAALLRQVTRGKDGASIFVRKHIPVAAGLGGGSSDGAAVLRMLNQLWHTGLGRQARTTLAAQLGSDVPFFLLGGTAIAEGRGEVLRPINAPVQCGVLLVKPAIAVSTAAVYGMVRKTDYSDGAFTARFAAQPRGTPPERWPLFNSLQRVTCAAHPIVGAVLVSLAQWGALQSLMCGSGPTCFGLFPTAEDAQQVAPLARAKGWEAWVTEFA